MLPPRGFDRQAVRAACSYDIAADEWRWVESGPSWLDKPQVTILDTAMKQITSKQLDACPAGTAEAVAFLRREGFSKIESIYVLVHERGLPLSEAKLVVHTSETWNDARDRDDQFHDDLISAAAKLNDQA